MMREIAPGRFNRLVELERLLDHTIDTNRVTLNDKANLGSVDRLPNDARLSKWVELALNRNFNASDLIMEQWEVPAGTRGNGRVPYDAWFMPDAEYSKFKNGQVYFFVSTWECALRQPLP